ncbi:MAG TPA: hypothetical protein VMU54_05580, partial [Planctomycetota bacterium]|nr:hypothetical protein [Planctomycetota bacterium]
GVVTFHLALLPFFADVIPTRRAEANPASEQKIKARLETLGMSAADADRHIRDLSPAEANYFAQDVNRVQYAAGLYWYEWVGGLVLLVIVAIIIVIKA